MSAQRRRKVFDGYAGYDEAMLAYQGHVSVFGCTRMEWGFGRWLWLDEVRGESKLEYWERLAKIGILTQAGLKKLEAARKGQGAG